MTHKSCPVTCPCELPMSLTCDVGFNLLIGLNIILVCIITQNFYFDFCNIPLYMEL